MSLIDGVIILLYNIGMISGKSRVRNTPTNVYVPRENVSIESKAKSSKVGYSSEFSPISRYSEKPVLNQWLRNYRKRESPSIP